MTYHYIEPHQSYLNSIADFVLRSYSEHVDRVRILVPSSVICAALQKVFVNKAKAGAAILPSIIPLLAVGKESEMLYKIPSENIEVAGFIEQKLLLMNIIREYDAFALSALQASQLSEKLIRLFSEVEAGEIDITSISGVVEIDSAMHWLMTAQFLVDSYGQWQKSIAKIGKVTEEYYQKVILDIEARDLTSPTIVAGIFPSSKSLERFIAFLATSDRGVVIPPPFYHADIKTDPEPISKFYYLTTLLELWGYLNTDDHRAKNSKEPSLRLYESERVLGGKTLITSQTDLEEAELVAKLAAHHSLEGSVAVVTNNRDLLKNCSVILQKYGLYIQNLKGESLVTSKAVEFLLLMAASVINNDIGQLAALLKTPYLASEEACLFEIESLRMPGGTKDDHCAWSEDLFAKLAPLSNLKNNFHNFAKILKTHLECAMDIAPNLFSGEEGNVVCEFFRELVSASGLVSDISLEVYVDFIRQLLLGAKHFPESSSRIVALSPQDAAFMDFDTFILADCTEGSFPYHGSPDPWMTDKMKKQIGMRTSEHTIGEAHYYFYLLMHKSRVYITHALKSKGREKVLSRFAVSLVSAFEKAKKVDGLKPKHNWLGGEKVVLKEGSSNALQAMQDEPLRGMMSNQNLFPSSISATNIELLLRNPYGFYAKKILGMMKLEDINPETSFADFGTLIHDIIGLYTENYETSVSKTQLFLDIADKVFAGAYQHNKTQHWRAKINAIAEDFIEFDEVRRLELQAVYPEIYGEISLDICGRKIKVTAIADRIELTKSGDLYIMDYKTGVVPSIQSVKSGMSPQLVVEAIIAADGGFLGIPAAVSNKLIYVKIASSRPYFKITEIEISPEELQKHKEGLVRLLEGYVSGEADFVATPNYLYEPKYNDYKHLARKL